MRQRKELRQAVDAALQGITANGITPSLVVGRLDRLPSENQMVVRINEVDRNEAEALMGDGRVEAVATLTVSYIVGSGDGRDDRLDDVMQEVHNRLTADRSLGGKAGSLTWVGFEVEGTETGALAIGTATYDATYPRRV